MKKLFAKLLGISYLILLSGIGLLGMLLYSAYNADNGGGIPEESALSAASGQAVEGREVTLETKRRRGIDSREMFYEIDLKQADGKILKLRIDHDIPKEQLEPALGENLTVKYDPSDNNMTYHIAKGSEVLAAYPQFAQLAQTRADKQAEFFGGSGMYTAAFSWIVIGGIGVFLRRRMLSSINQTNPQA